MSEESSLEVAAERCNFRLTYSCTEASRRLHRSGIEGTSIPNSYWHIHGPGDGRFATACGDWEGPAHPADHAPQSEHIARWFSGAVSEAVHEALEWFHVDGQPYLDPHGEHADVIHALAERFAGELAALHRPPPSASANPAGEVAGESAGD